MYCHYLSSIKRDKSMKAVRLRREYGGNRRGMALLFMVLIVVLAGILLVYDPFALFGSRDPNMPWNQVRWIVPQDKKVPAPSAEQARITRTLMFRADAMLEDEKRGRVEVMLQRDGRIEGEWSAEYDPEPGINYQVVKSGFKGNIVPSRIYKDEYGKDRSLLFFITQGKLMIMETNSQTQTVRAAKGRIYVRGWLDTEYNAKGEIIITSDKKSYKSFSWEAEGTEGMGMFEFFKLLGK